MVAVHVTDYLGWVATAVFVASYLFRQPQALRIAQMCGAILWVAYGALIAATPVIVANLLVFSAAAWATARVVVARRSLARKHGPCAITESMDT